MKQLNEAAKALLRRPILATATTIRRDGSLHSTLVWVDEDDGEVIFTIAVGQAKERNLRRDPRVAVSLIDPDRGFLSVSGTARLELEGAEDVRDELARKYRGTTTPRPPGQRVAVRVTADSILQRPER